MADEQKMADQLALIRQELVTLNVHMQTISSALVSIDNKQS